MVQLLLKCWVRIWNNSSFLRIPLLKGHPLVVAYSRQLQLSLVRFDSFTVNRLGWLGEWAGFMNYVRFQVIFVT